MYYQPKGAITFMGINSNDQQSDIRFSGMEEPSWFAANDFEAQEEVFGGGRFYGSDSSKGTDSRKKHSDHGRHCRSDFSSSSSSSFSSRCRKECRKECRNEAFERAVLCKLDRIEDLLTDPKIGLRSINKKLDYLHSELNDVKRGLRFINWKLGRIYDKLGDIEEAFEPITTALDAILDAIGDLDDDTIAELLREILCEVQKDIVVTVERPGTC